MFQEDWFMRQVEDFAKMLAKIIFNKETTDYDVFEANNLSNTDLLHFQLIQLIDEGKINEAENLLFDEIETKNKRYLEVAIDFYARLNDLNDTVLENNNFTRKEIDEGLKEVAGIFGISFI